MNEDKYEAAEEKVDELNIWVDDKVLLKSVIARARKLEKENQWLYGKLNQIDQIIQNGRGEINKL